MQLNISSPLSKLIAVFVLAIAIALSSTSVQAADSLIIGDDLTITDIEYSEAEIKEFQIQLRANKETLRNYYLTRFTNSTNKEFEQTFADAIQQDQMASSLFCGFYENRIQDQINKNSLPSIDDVRIFAFLNYKNTLHGRAIDQYVSGINFAYCKPVLSEKDTKRFLYWLSKAANGGHEAAAYTVGLYYYFELDNYPNNTRLKALTQNYLIKSAEAGNIGGALILSRYYRFEENDTTKAAKWLKVAAEGGIPEAEGELASIYITGEGVKTDYKKSFYWAKKGIEANDPISFTVMGLLYENGLGINTDYQKALTHYDKSCDLGESTGCKAYNRLYFILNQPNFEEQNGFYYSK